MRRTRQVPDRVRDDEPRVVAIFPCPTAPAMLYLARLLATEGAANGHIPRLPRGSRRPTWLARTERTSVRTRSPPLPPRRLDRRPADRLHRERFPSIPKRSSAAASMESSSRPSRPPRRAHVRARTHTRAYARAHMSLPPLTTFSPTYRAEGSDCAAIVIFC